MDKPTFTASTPTDLIALAPVALGFHPEDSIVLLTFDRIEGRQFHARVDLPPPDDLAQVVRLLVDPVARHRIRAAAVLVFSHDVELTVSVAAALVPALSDAGCGLAAVLRVDDECYQDLLDPGAGPVPYDVSGHPITAQAVFLGRRTLGNRAEVADQLVGADEDEVAAVRAAAVAAVDDWATRGGRDRWVTGVIGRWLKSRSSLEVGECGALLHLLADERVRNLAWQLIDPDTCEALTDFWVHLLRRCPDELLPAPAALLGFSAWLSGDGALAWCGVDRCLGQDPDYPLGHLLAGLLQEATPPPSRSWLPPAQSA